METTMSKDKELESLEERCEFCRIKLELRGSLIEEDGSTRRSLHNLHVLCRQSYFPKEVHFEDNGEPSEFYVMTKWKDLESKEIKEHKFTGFGWGHVGTGSQGFVKFLRVISERGAAFINFYE